MRHSCNHDLHLKFFEVHTHSNTFALITIIKNIRLDFSQKTIYDFPKTSLTHNNILYFRLSWIKYNIKQLLHINMPYNYKSFKNISTANGIIQFPIFFLLNNINSKIKKEKWMRSLSNILNAYTYLSCLLWRCVIINFRTILTCSNIFVSHTFFVVSTNYFENPQFFFFFFESCKQVRYLLYLLGFFTRDKIHLSCTSAPFWIRHLRIWLRERIIKNYNIINIIIFCSKSALSARRRRGHNILVLFR